MSQSIFKKTNRKKIQKGDIFSFILHGRFYYGRVFFNHYMGLLSYIYQYTTDKLDEDQYFSNMAFFTPPLILDGYSLFQRKSEGDWGIIQTDPAYEIPVSLYPFKFFDRFFDPTTDVSIQVINVFGINETINNLELERKYIADTVICGDYDVEHYYLADIFMTEIFHKVFLINH